MGTQLREAARKLGKTANADSVERWRPHEQGAVKPLMKGEWRWAAIEIACSIAVALVLGPGILLLQVMLALLALIAWPRPAAVGGIAAALSLVDSIFC